MKACQRWVHFSATRLAQGSNDLIRIPQTEVALAISNEAGFRVHENCNKRLAKWNYLKTKFIKYFPFSEIFKSYFWFDNYYFYVILLTVYEIKRTEELINWFKDLDLDAKKDILVQIEILQEFGPRLGRPHVDTVTGSKIKNLKGLIAKIGLFVFSLFLIQKEKPFYSLAETRLLIKHFIQRWLKNQKLFINYI